MEESSILQSTKKALGIQPDYEHFDPELLMHINSAFGTLHQLGVGPDTGFFVNSNSTKWAAYTVSDVILNQVKSYIYLKVKLVFDSPATSHARTSLQDMTKELEWRLHVEAENEYS